jgi:hypothetical protein
MLKYGYLITLLCKYYQDPPKINIFDYPSNVIFNMDKR